MNTQNLVESEPICIAPEEFQHNCLIVTVDRSVGPKSTHIDEQELYECTRKWWKVDVKKANKVDFVIAKYQGELKQIYQVTTNWFQEKNSESGRYGFEGVVVNDPEIRNLYLNKKLTQKTHSPIIYIFKNS